MDETPVKQNKLLVERRFDRDGTPKRHAINILLKKNVIDDVDNGMKYAQIKDKYGLKHISNITRIVKERRKLNSIKMLLLLEKLLKQPNILTQIKAFVTLLLM